MKKVLLSAAVVGCGLLLAQSAQAVQLTFSENTNQMGTIIRLGGGVPLPANLSLNAGIGIAPNNLGSIIKPEKPDTSLLGIKWDALLDLDLNIAYDWTIISAEFGPLGEFKPTLSPYLGYRHMFTWTGQPEVSLSLNPSAALKSFNTQLGGINAGLKFNLTLPLGFSAYADGGATILTGGGFSGDFDVNITDKDDKVLKTVKEGNINTNGTLLPHVGVGARWALPFLELASLYAGYNLLFLPDNLRYKTDTLSGKNSMVHSVNFGLNILFFSI